MRRKGRFIMRRQYEREHGGSWRGRGSEGWREREQDDRDAYGEYPGQYGGNYDDAERRFARNAYEHGERDTGAWGMRGWDSRGYGERSYGQGGRDWERSGAARQGYGGRDYGESDYAGQGYGERNYGGQRWGSGGGGYGGQSYGGQNQRYGGYGGRDDAQSYGARDYGQGYRRSESGSMSYQQPSRDRWESGDFSGMPGYRGAGGQSSGGRSSNESNRGFRGRGPKGYARADERIREEVCERLSDEDIDVGEVEVQVSSGQVTLSGTVDDRHTKREAETIAEGVSGVKDVSNQIRVRSEKDKHQEGTQNVFGNKHSIGENEKHAH
jgi:osmotically-inducible protein OsmY